MSVLIYDLRLPETSAKEVPWRGSDSNRGIVSYFPNYFRWARLAVVRVYKDSWGLPHTNTAQYQST